jgi:hypothetical protein
MSPAAAAEAVERGKRKVLLLVGGLFVIGVVGALHSFFAGNSLQPLDIAFPAFLLWAGLALYRGRKWARWALVMGIGLNAIALLLFAFIAFDSSARTAFLAAILGGLNLTVAILLLTSSDVDALVME